MPPETGIGARVGWVDCSGDRHIVHPLAQGTVERGPRWGSFQAVRPSSVVVVNITLYSPRILYIAGVDGGASEQPSRSSRQNTGVHGWTRAEGRSVYYSIVGEKKEIEETKRGIRSPDKLGLEKAKLQCFLLTFFFSEKVIKRYPS